MVYKDFLIHHFTTLLDILRSFASLHLRHARALHGGFGPGGLPCEPRRGRLGGLRHAGGRRMGRQGGLQRLGQSTSDLGNSGLVVLDVGRR